MCIVFILFINEKAPPILAHNTTLYQKIVRQPPVVSAGEYILAVTVINERKNLTKSQEKIYFNCCFDL